MREVVVGIPLVCFALAMAVSGCDDPDCRDGERKIGKTCWSIRDATAAGNDSETGDAGTPNEFDAALSESKKMDASASPEPSVTGRAQDSEAEGRADPGSDSAAPVVAARCYLDRDGDGAGDPAAPVDCVDPPVDAGPSIHVVATGDDCDDTNPKRAPTLTDICGDMIDNDCDGVADDKSNNACGGPCGTALTNQPGQHCDNGLPGACTRTGVYTCQGTAGTVCNAVAASGTPEICDAIDNDCDGVVDNELFNECGGSCTTILAHKPGETCTNGQLGACATTGVYTCQGVETGCNAQPMHPGVESCVADGVDNDCDGTVDNLGPKTVFGGGFLGQCVPKSPTPG